MPIGLQGGERNILTLLRNPPPETNEDVIDMGEDMLPDLVQNDNLEEFFSVMSAHFWETF